jgi:hypothetical protein
MRSRLALYHGARADASGSGDVARSSNPKIAQIVEKNIKSKKA